MGSSSNNEAVYLGTFDPLTYGHLDIIERSCRIFKKLTLGIGTNSNKSASFTPEIRAELARIVTKKFANVDVEIFSGLAVDFAKRIGADVMVRGIRTEADFVYEMQMAIMNRTLAPGMETIFIPSRQELSHISSSLVKEVAALGGNVSSLVPNEVFLELRKKYSNY